MHCHVALLQRPREALRSPGETVLLSGENIYVIPRICLVGSKPLNQYFSGLNSYLSVKGV